MWGNGGRQGTQEGQGKETGVVSKLLVDYQAGLAFAAGSAEVLAAKPTAGYDAKWGGFVIHGKKFTGLGYQGV
jgi:hypothetical protein